MAVGRADLHRLFAMRRQIEAALRATDIPLPDGRVAPRRELRVIPRPTREDYRRDIWRDFFVPEDERRANPRQDYTPGDPLLVIEPPLWSWEQPALLALRQPLKWPAARRHPERIESVRVVCRGKKHKLGDALWIDGEPGRLASFGSRSAARMLRERRGQLSADDERELVEAASARVIHQPQGDGPETDREFLALAGVKIKCPVHGTVGESYPLTMGYRRQVSLFSTTSKMSTLSWSLPAGAPLLGGCCRSANLAAGMGGPARVWPDDFRGRCRRAYLQARKHVRATLGFDPAQEQVWGEQTLAELLAGGQDFAVAPTRVTSGLVCDSCYALKGSYATITTQFAQILRLWWLQEVLGRTWDPSAHQGMGGFVGRGHQLEHAAQLLADCVRGALSEPARRHGAGHSHQHFRVHDSGDFSDEVTVELWGRVCALVPEVRFWFPTRIWSHAGLRAPLVRAAQAAPNMIVRASSYRFGEPPPAVPGLAAGTGAGAGGSDEGRWPCPAYLARDATCGNAVNPWGERYLVETYGAGALAWMQRRAWNQDEWRYYEEQGLPAPAWLESARGGARDARTPGAKAIKKLEQKLTATRRGGSKRLPSREALRQIGAPEYEQVLYRDWKSGKYAEWAKRQAGFTGAVPPPLECRVCWGGGGAVPDVAPDGASLARLSVAYHEH